MAPRGAAVASSGEPWEVARWVAVAMRVEELAVAARPVVGQRVKAAASSGDWQEAAR